MSGDSGLKTAVDFDVVVVGAGFAGCIAARELSQAGLHVALIEARDRVGGRTWYQADALQGMPLEMGGTWIDPRQTCSWSEAQHYGIDVGSPVHGAPPMMWLTQAGPKLGILPLEAEDVPGAEKLVVALNAASSRIQPDVALSDQGLEDLDVSLDEFLATVSVPDSVRELAAAYLSAYGSAQPCNVSALHILRRMAAAGSLSEFILSGASHPLVEGTEALLEAILRDAASADVFLSSPVRRIERHPGRVVATTDNAAFAAPMCVLAVPVNVWKTIEFAPALSDEKRALSAERLAGQGAKVWALVDDAPANFSAVGSRGGAVQMVWRDALAVEQGVLLVAYGSDPERLDPRRPDLVRSALAEFLPNVKVLACAGHAWSNDPFSLGTWSVFRPGQIHRYEHSMRRSEAEIVFAGADLAYRWPGFMDGAIETGLRAAREVLSTIHPTGNHAAVAAAGD